MNRQATHIQPSHNLYNSTCLAPAEALTQMMSGFRVTQLIYVAAELSIADLVQDAPKSADELASLVGVNHEALYRVMRGLASIGVFAQQEDGRFVQTPYSYYLQTGIPGSLRPRILFWGQEWNQRAWSNILQTVKTGESGFNAAFGMGFFESLAQHSQVTRRFDEHIASRTTACAHAVVTAYDFSQFDNIVCVGGGYGALIVPILQANPHMSGVVFDLPSASEVAKQYIETAGLTERCSVIAGNFFASVPKGGDLYVLSEVIHSYDDDSGLAILKNCHQAMAAGGSILLVEKVMTPCNATSFEMIMQHITLLLETGGRERTEDEYAALLQAADFALTKTIPTESPLSVIEGVPLEASLNSPHRRQFNENIFMSARGRGEASLNQPHLVGGNEDNTASIHSFALNSIQEVHS